MNFSNTIKYTGLSSFSPDANYLAIVKNASLIIYENKDLRIIQKYQFPNPISNIIWSPDSTLILISFCKQGICEVRSVHNSKFICSINESQSGIIYSRFTPDSRKIIIFNDFSVRLSIWSLIDKSTVYINNPKFPDKGIAFSENGNFMALAEKDNKDYIGIYFTGDFSLVSRFPTETFDLQDIIWNSSNIIVIDSSLECKLLFYSPTGNLLAAHSPYSNAIGFEIGKLSPNNRTLAMGCGDACIRLYNPMTYKEIASLNHSINVISNDMLVSVFKEEEISGKNKFSKYVECSFPYKLHNKGKSIFGSVSMIEWSYDSQFIASKFDAMNNVIYIWESNSLSLHTVIIQNKPIKEFKWRPNENMLLAVTENAKLYTFAMDNIYVVELVSDSVNPIAVTKVEWSKDGMSFIVSDKKQMMIGHPYTENVNENMENNEEDNINNNLENEEEEENNINTQQNINQNFNDNMPSEENLNINTSTNNMTKKDNKYLKNFSQNVSNNMATNKNQSEEPSNFYAFDNNDKYAFNNILYNPKKIASLKQKIISNQTNNKK